MNKKFLFNWSIWIGAACGAYTLFNDLIGGPFLWMSFAALPVYFMGGVKTEEFFNYTASILVAVVWGFIYLATIGFLNRIGLPALLASAIGVGVIVAIHCAVHLIFTTPKTFVNILPITFTVVSLCFFSPHGGETLVPAVLSVFGGVVLGLVCGIGRLFLSEEGKWTMPKSGALGSIFRAPKQVE